MELKTESGVSIIIIDDGSSKVLIFDKAVRAVELNKKEVSKISAVLSSDSKAGRSAAKAEPTKAQDSTDITPEVF